MFLFHFRKGFYKREVVETKTSRAFTDPVKKEVCGGLVVTAANQDSEKFRINPGYERNISPPLHEERKKPRLKSRQSVEDQVLK